MSKRCLDISAAALGLIVCWPVLLLAAVLIKWESAGPVFFTQVRIGKGFRPFRIYKLRTMVQDASAKGGPLTVGHDPRVTRVGAVLRRYKLDELPQLLNVLKGDMSVVGPRPEVPPYVEAFRDDYATILKVRPGLTDLASLTFIDEAAVLEQAKAPEEEYRCSILPEKIRLAKLYVTHSSLQFDLAIIAQTMLCLLGLPLVVCELPTFSPTLRPYPSSLGSRFGAWCLRWRRSIIVMVDIALIILSNYLAFWLRFDGDIPPLEHAFFVQMLPWLVLIRGAVFFAFRLNEGLWRYTGMWDLQRIVGGVMVSTVLFYVWVHHVVGLTGYARSIFIIDSMVLIGFITGVRLPRRLLRDTAIYRFAKKALIVGAADAGERIVREMKTQVAYRYQPIGFIDERPGLVHQRIHGVKVLGTRKDLPAIVRREKPDEVILAMPDASPAVIRDIIASLEPCKVVMKTVPSENDLSPDRSAVSQIRSLAVADLLPRAPVHTDSRVVRDMLAGNRVLITGAGGSIGSELARQIAALRPEALILYERHENSLYTIAKELEDGGFAAPVHAVIGDVTDNRRLSSVLERLRPNIVFHAAAHKHVPLVELNPAEAMKNNCMGTRIAAEAADRYGIDRFVLISTDKAVNPSSVMGATKRVAELVVQDIARHSRTRFSTVRFGNVLGSNGSVLLRFQEQIRAGGPVTVTHPSVRRYFMLIPEAVYLVLQAASLGEQGATYVLDMGEQIKVLDLARNVIRLSGFVPGEEIPIVYVGLRPGEKLFEELVGEGELAEPSPIAKISRVAVSPLRDPALFARRVSALEHAASMNHSARAMMKLRELVPSFSPPPAVADGDGPREAGVHGDPIVPSKGAVT